MGKHQRPYLNAEGVLVKVCRECQIEKPLTQFNYHNKRKSEARRQECKDCEAAYTRAWRERNPEPVKAYSRERRRLESSIGRKALDTKLRVGISNFLRGVSSGESAFQNLEFTGPELRAHLESRFFGRMTWGNYGRFGWHVDHRIPLAAFNYETPTDANFKAAWALSNLQPLWWHENAWKGARVAANDNDGVELDFRGRQAA